MNEEQNNKPNFLDQLLEYAREEMEERREKNHFGFARRFRVFEDYDFDGEYLVRVGDVKYTYNPDDIPDLPNIIGKVNYKSERQILKFVKRYGELLNNNVAPLNEEMVNKKTDIVHHIKTIRLCLDLLYCFKHEDEEEAERIIKADFEIWESGGRLYASRKVNFPHERTEDHILADNWLDSSKAIFINLVNQNIKNIRRKAYLVNREVKSLFEYKSLADLAYWKLLDNAENGKIKKCAYCGTPFLQSNAVQQFCPPDGFSKESRCGLAYRQKLYREKQKRKQKGD